MIRAALLLNIGLSSGARAVPPARNLAEPPAARAPLHVGAMLGVVSLPRPADAELFVHVYDFVSVGVSYSDFPGVVADALLSAVGAKSDSMNARLDDFSAVEVDLRVMPFHSEFFVGSSFGRQTVRGAVTQSTLAGPQTATVDVSSWYATPRAGWLWTLERGFILGVDLGVQLKLTGDVTVKVPPGTPPSVQKNAQNLADVGSSYPLPSLHLRVGWML